MKGLKLNRISLLLGVFFLFSLLLLPTSVLAGVKITSPADGETVGGIVPVTVSYSGTLLYPVIYLASGLFGRYDLAQPELSGTYTYYWDTTYTPNGTQKGIYVAGVFAGFPNGTSDIISVTVNNPYPIVNIASPTEGTYISPETTNLSVTLEYHNVLPNYHGIRYISFVTSRDDVRRLNLPDNPASGSYTWNLDIRNYPLGEHWILAYCEDTSGKGTYTRINFIKGNPPLPKVDPTKEPEQSKITTVAEPINIANGNMFISQTNILIPSKEIPLELSRTYNSQDDFNGSFGWGWRSNFDITLTEQLDQSIIEVDEKRVYTIYTKNPDGTYSPSAGKYSALTKNLNGTYTILRKHGRKLYFDSQGRLIKIEERNTSLIDTLRTSDGIISEVSDSAGRRLLFTQDSQGRITQVKDPLNRVFKYEYDSSGNLIKAIDPLNNQTLYQYDNNHNLIAQTDVNGYSLYFEYDASDRTYHSWQDGNNNEVTLSFDTANKTTIATDSLGNITKYEYNDYGLVTKIIDSQNNVQTFVWDSNLNKTSSTNQSGFTTTFTYDTRGNLLTIKDPLNNTTTLTYEPDFDLLSSITDALGNKTEYLYDTKGNLVRIEDALGSTTNYSYDAQGQLIQTQDANGNITNFNYDSYGNLIQIIDALNNQTIFTYDIIGNVIQITDAKGNSTEFSYDLLNRLTQISYPDNSKVIYSYDAVGNLISFTDPNNHATTYTYDVVNRLTQVTDALGDITQYTYNTGGNRLSIIDANSNKTQYFYDSLNRLIKTVDPLNNQTIFNYDPVGNLTSKTDAKSNTINYTYDALNRLTKKQYPDLTEETFTYDAKGNILTATNLNISYIFTYNSLGQLAEVINSNNQSLTYEYGPVGNKIKMTTPEGKTISYTYDALNRLTSIIDIYGNSTTYTYDGLGRRTNSTFPNKTTASYTYDDLNNLLSLINKTGDDSILSSYTYEYDKAGNRLSKIEPDLKTSYTYDVLYRLAHVISGELKDESKEQKDELYTYDALGNRLTSLKDTYIYNAANQLLSSKKYTYEYDQNGNLTKKVEVDDDAELKTTYYTYDYENRLIKVRIQEEDETKTISFKYDPFGRRIEKRIEEQEEGKIESKTSTYIYNNEDIILEYTTKKEDSETKEEIIRYVHGPGIDELILIEKDNQIYYYHYDGLGSITALTDGSAKTIETYEYNSFGNLKHHGDKVKNPFTYTAREYDKETGLYYYRNRYYDLGAGRFITQDPIGLIGGFNLYTYVGNNPVNLIDPWGLKEEEPWWKPDPGFWERFWDQFYKDRLPVISWFSIWPIPRGAAIAIGSDIAFRGFRNLAAREATRHFTSFSGTKNVVYMTGYQSEYLTIAKSLNILRNLSTALTLWGTVSDLGTAIESVIYTWRDER